ncbi:MAG: MYXO-CTERM sorting domain-containing protein [Nannocystaceae bacterium]
MAAPGPGALACDVCFGWQSVHPRFGASIPADGVLSFRIVGDGAPSSASLRRIDGVEPAEVAVAVEALEAAHLVVLRPQTPLVPGLSYEAVMGASSCAGEAVQHHFEVLADPPGSAAPSPLPVTAEFSTEVVLDVPGEAEVVCCEREDFSAGWEYLGCGLEFRYDDRCTSTRGRALLHAELTVDSTMADPAGQIAYFYTDREGGPIDGDGDGDGDGDLRFASFEPFCVRSTALNLVTGEQAMAEALCPDEALASALGERSLDPGDALACEGPYWSCEEAADSGLPECSRFGSGCGCVVEEPAPSIAGLLLLLALPRRRRRRRAATRR